VDSTTVTTGITVEDISRDAKISEGHLEHGPVSAIHIDAHIDTWNPKVFAGSNGVGSKQAQFSHGTPYYWASLEGLVTETCVHADIRSSLDSLADIAADGRSGFTIIPASDIFNDGGIAAIVKRIRDVVSLDGPAYVSLDIDLLDPAYAPGTAGPLSGGWTTRQVIQLIIDGLKGMNIVGVDIVEVLPGMDSAEITAVAAADMVFEVCRHFTPLQLAHEIQVDYVLILLPFLSS
jgi:agmatinase